MRPSVGTVALVAGVALLVVACGDSRLDKLSLGLGHDSVATVMGVPAHRETNYLSAGRTWDVQFYDRDHAAPGDSVAWRKMSPVVFINGKTVGWGWKWWDATAAKRHLPVTPGD
jgi:hypothetical protein